MEHSLFVADYQPVSLIEYPGKISSVIFTHGCQLRCRYCHNPALVRGFKGENRLYDFLRYLEDKEIEAVAITGGEPLFSSGTAGFMRDMKSRRLALKLDTNGFSPKKLEKICAEGLVDYVAVDIKAFSDEKLKDIVRVEVSMSMFYETISILNNYDIASEVRHTVWEIPQEKEIMEFAQKSGVSKIFVQRIRPAKMLDKTFCPPNAYDSSLKEIFQRAEIEAVIR